MRTLADILKELRELAAHPYDLEIDHVTADELLCQALLLLGQEEIVRVWQGVEKCYA